MEAGCLSTRVQLPAMGAQRAGLCEELGWPASVPLPRAGGQARPCPRGRCSSPSGRRPEDPECSTGPLLGPFSLPGPSEDNPPVQVIPTPTPLVPNFQVLLLDLLKVLQQLCVVDAGGIRFLRLGGCLWTVSGEEEGLSISLGKPGRELGARWHRA